MYKKIKSDEGPVVVKSIKQDPGSSHADKYCMKLPELFLIQHIMIIIPSS